MYIVQNVSDSRDAIASAKTGSGVSSVFLLLKLPALVTANARGSSRESQHQQPFQGVHMLEATTSRLKSIVQIEKALSEKACFWMQGKDAPLLDTAHISGMCCQIGTPSVAPRGYGRQWMLPITVPEVIPVLPREPVLSSVFLSVGILRGADFVVLLPSFYVPEFEKRMNIRACWDSDVFVAIMGETAAGMLALFLA
ncbi:uncharacterized protein LOC144116127 [Amblyomma americanum]